MSVISKIRRKPELSDRVIAPAAAVAEPPPDGRAMPIGDVEWRQHVRVSGKIRSVKVQPWSGVATLEATLMDETGGISVVFLGRRRVAGIHPGSKLTVEGTVGEHAGRLAILNPEYEIEAPPEH